MHNHVIDKTITTIQKISFSFPIYKKIYIYIIDTPIYYNAHIELIITTTFATKIKNNNKILLINIFIFYI